MREREFKGKVSSLLPSLRLSLSVFATWAKLLVNAPELVEKMLNESLAGVEGWEVSKKNHD